MSSKRWRGKVQQGRHCIGHRYWKELVAWVFDVLQAALTDFLRSVMKTVRSKTFITNFLAFVMTY